ncbi:MAG: hypothetical protein H6835_13480 [Planctomycetes bacterium]|nr:hypothetical protein [Planctomycetota bacterium]
MKLFTALLACAALSAQQQQPQPAGIGGPGLLQGGQQGPDGSQGQGAQQQDPRNDEFGQIWQTAGPRQFEGFPTFPSRLRGYGNYPLPVDPSAAAPTGDAPTGGGALPMVPFPFPLGAGAAAEPRKPDWPDWVHAQSKAPLPFAPELALLVRQADRVWWRATGDEPFVPLYFHDKFTTLTAGGEVEVRQVGRFELLLHESTRIETRGPTRLRVVSLDARQVQLAIPSLTWCRLHVTSREHAITLPDGSTLHISEPAPEAVGAPANPLAGLLQGAAPAAAAAPVARSAWVELMRADEPGAYNGRATMTNLGDRDVTWRHAFGEVVLHPGERVTLLLTPPATTIGNGLDAAATQWQNEAGVVTCRAQDAAEVGWSGARVAVPAGGVVRFESLQGDAFVVRPNSAAPSPGSPGAVPAAVRSGG